MTMTKGIGYGASKEALNKWTKHAALDLAQYGIRVIAIAPGVIEAGMNEDTASSNPELWQYYVSNIPLQRPGTPMTLQTWFYSLPQRRPIGLQEKSSQWMGTCSLSTLTQSLFLKLKTI